MDNCQWLWQFGPSLSRVENGYRCADIKLFLVHNTKWIYLWIVQNKMNRYCWIRFLYFFNSSISVLSFEWFNKRFETKRDLWERFSVQITGTCNHFYWCRNSLHKIHVLFNNKPTVTLKLTDLFFIWHLHASFHSTFVTFYI